MLVLNEDRNSFAGRLKSVINALNCISVTYSSDISSDCSFRSYFTLSYHRHHYHHHRFPLLGECNNMLVTAQE
jgi:hypothetical protein